MMVSNFQRQYFVSASISIFLPIMEFFYKYASSILLVTLDTRGRYSVIVCVRKEMRSKGETEENKIERVLIGFLEDKNFGRHQERK